MMATVRTMPLIRWLLVVVLAARCPPCCGGAHEVDYVLPLIKYRVSKRYPDPATRPSKRVLVIGCGNGVGVAMLWRLGFCASGTETSTAAVSAVQAALVRPTSSRAVDVCRGEPCVQRGSLSVLPFPDGAFSALVCARSLGDVPASLVSQVVLEFTRVVTDALFLALNVRPGADIATLGMLGSRWWTQRLEASGVWACSVVWRSSVNGTAEVAERVWIECVRPNEEPSRPAFTEDEASHEESARPTPARSSEAAHSSGAVRSAARTRGGSSSASGCASEYLIAHDGHLSGKGKMWEYYHFLIDFAPRVLYAMRNQTCPRTILHVPGWFNDARFELAMPDTDRTMWPQARAVFAGYGLELRPYPSAEREPTGVRVLPFNTRPWSEQPVEWFEHFRQRTLRLTHVTTFHGSEPGVLVLRRGWGLGLGQTKRECSKALYCGTGAVRRHLPAQFFDDAAAWMRAHGIRHTIAELDAMPLLQQAQLFADADVVLGIHGGGLSNIIFCAPGTTVVELGKRASYCFRRLASKMRLAYHHPRDRDRSFSGVQQIVLRAVARARKRLAAVQSGGAAAEGGADAGGAEGDDEADTDEDGVDEGDAAEG